jgi:hypothetical protein
MNRSQRKKYINCKIKGLSLRSENSTEAGIRRRIFADITNKKANKEIKYT